MMPGAVDSINADIKGIPGQIFGWLAAAACGAMAWRWTNNSDAALLFAALGGYLMVLYFKVERLFLQQQIREEQTRAIVREEADQHAHELLRIQDDLATILAEYRHRYSDPTRDA